MKRAKILGFMVAIMIAVVALSAELHRAEVTPSKAQPQLVVVRSGGEIVAEVKVNSGKLKIEAEDLAYRQIPGDGMAYNCSGIGNVELTVGGGL